MKPTALELIWKQDVPNTLPLLILCVGGFLVMLLEAFSRMRLVGHKHHKNMPAETSEAYAMAIPGSRTYLMLLTAVVLLVALGFVVWQWMGFDTRVTTSYVLAYQNMLQIDRFGLFALGICLVAGLLSLGLAPAFLQRRKMEYGEYYALVLFALAGMNIVIMAADLVALFLGIEILSLGVYVLTGSWRKSIKSSEAAMKYFLMGAFVSAIIIYGIALLYGVTGTTNLLDMRHVLEQTSLAGMHGTLFLAGCLLVVAGLLFKVGVVPLHMWAPDAYDGAPTPVTAFMMATVKVAAFSALARLMDALFQGTTLTSRISAVLYVLAILTMALGNLAALRQSNIKRMLAYSSIGHAGYLLLAILTSHFNLDGSRSALLYYLLTYSIAAVGTMGILVWVGQDHPQEEPVHLDAWAGLGKKRPVVALCMTLFLLSLAGFPPTAGFFAKFSLFRVAFHNTTLWPLVFVALLTSLISVAYYLRIIMVMYFQPGTGTFAKPESTQPGNTALKCAVLILTLATIGLGLLPNWFLSVTSSAILGRSFP